MDVFLVMFQKYCLEKEIGMDTSFMLLDLFDKIRPSMKRIENLEQANKEIALLKEQNCLYPISSREVSTTREATENFDDDSDGGDDDISGGSDQDEPDTLAKRSVAGPESSVDDSGVGGGGGGVSSRGEGSGIVADAVEADEYKRPQLPEEMQFDQELNAMIVDSLKEARSSGTSAQFANNSLPSVPATKRVVAASSSPSPQDSDPNSSSSRNSDEIPFRLLVKRGTKMVTREISVPMESSLAQFNQRKSHEDRSKQLEIKRAVLEYEQRAEERSTMDDIPPIQNDFARPKGRGRGGVNREGSNQPGAGRGQMGPGLGNFRIFDLSNTRPFESK
eukprot:c1736_g1_i1.p1 GENE.c1736_g1_i1~~c1736_g1_i1.p1  ORF type:complete len:386 (+),score=106.02 c1736_g1_i1:157-1158(+)